MGINNLEIEKHLIEHEITLNAMLEKGTTVGQMAFWDGTKWVKTETSELFWDDTNKRVGIGTTSPTGALTINQTPVVPLVIPALNFGDGDTGIGERSDDSLTFVSVGTEVFYIDSNEMQSLGGAGTIRLRFLDSSESAPTYTFTGSGRNDDGMWSSEAGNISFSTNGAEAMRIKDGNVGIGTTTPDTKLQVVGDFKSGDDNTNYLSLASDGELSLTGTARVKRHVWATAESFRPSGATMATQGLNTHLVFRNNFDDEAYYSTHVPYRWASGTDIEVVLVWYYTGGNDNNNCEWNVSYNSVADGEDPTGAGTALAEQAVAIATDDTTAYTTFTIPAAALATHDNLYIKIWRDGSDALTADALLLGAHVHFTMDKLGEAT